MIFRALRSLRHQRTKRLIDTLGRNVKWRGSVYKARGGRVEIGDDSIVASTFVLHRPATKITVGARCFLGERTLLETAEAISIGDDVLVSYDVVIMDHDAHPLRWSERSGDVMRLHADQKDWTNVSIRPVIIGDRCWIGARSILLKGVTLGPECVVAAGAVVTKSFPGGSVVAGNPARVVRSLE